MLKEILKLGVFLLLSLNLTSALPPAETYQEGACNPGNLKPVRISPELSAQLSYIPGGSRYHLYRIAANMRNYSAITEPQLINSGCYSQNINVPPPENPYVSGFGGILTRFKIEETSTQDYLDITNLNLNEKERLWVTLSDQKTFAFVYACWSNENRRGWVVISLTPSLEQSTRRQIEEHATQMGFNRNNFLYLNYSRCT